VRFTVLTPTFNRARYLELLYESLCAQTFKDFEWVIVDDGSTDGTGELVASWKSFFPIRYAWKPNGGKHTAVNHGVRMAAGELLFILDSDDRCLPHSLERFDFHWRNIPDPERFAFVVGLCYQDDGRTRLGPPFPAKTIDTFKLRDALALAPVDRIGIVRTDIMRRFPYPVFRNERNVITGLVWNRILRKYGARYVNEPLAIHVYAPGGLSSQRDLRSANPKGMVLFHTERALSDVPFRIRLISTIRVIQFAAHTLRRALLTALLPRG
jgi:glycosyltransferase involved in cell wall biosynthesis